LHPAILAVKRPITESPCLSVRLHGACCGLVARLRA